MQVSGQLHALTPLTPGKEPSGYPLDRRLGGSQSRFGRCKEKIMLRRESNLGRSTSFQSLYRLSYTDSRKNEIWKQRVCVLLKDNHLTVEWRFPGPQ
jgi:hypothetical protein